MDVLLFALVCVLTVVACLLLINRKIRWWRIKKMHSFVPAQSDADTGACFVPARMDHFVRAVFLAIKLSPSVTRQ